MKLHFAILFVALFAVTQASFIGLGQLYGYQPVIQGSNAVIPLCFPRGFPYATAPVGKCYNVGFPGSIDYRNGPCLPPIVQGVMVPPCQGNYFTLASYY